MSAVPACQHPDFEQWALVQLHLYKLHCSIYELSTPTISCVFDAHVTAGGFPNIDAQQEDMPEDEGPAPNLNDCESDLLEQAPLETHLLQDDYHELMNIGRTHCSSSGLLGVRELNLIHNWPMLWRSILFDTLVSWVVNTQKDAVLQPVSVMPLQTDSFSSMQRLAFSIVCTHCFGTLQNKQLLMIVIGTAGTGKSFLINSIRSLFAEHHCTDQVKITAPTGIAAANILGSTIYSLLSLNLPTLTGQRLLALQNVMRDVRLLIIDKFSFMGAPVFDCLDRHLRLIYPYSDRPFGGLNILLCGNPAQLPPVHTQPMYAHCGVTAHLAARFHFFQTVIELDQPFRQIGSDSTQTCFHTVLERIADCDAQEEDWHWLQSHRVCCLADSKNASFDDSMYIVSTNAIRDKINCEKLAALLPIMKIEHSEEGVHLFNDDTLDGECINDGDLNMFTVGARVILSTNLWMETGLVNGACGIVDALLQPITPSKTRVVMVDFPNYRGLLLSPFAPTVVPVTQIRSQYFAGLPLSLSWAITIHKSQGMSMDRVTVDLGRTEFAARIMFVALSRARHFDGLRVVAFDFDRYRHIEHGKNMDAHRAEFRQLRILAAATIAFVLLCPIPRDPPFLTSTPY
jgi:ATP-dependent DNA helicase PIF1